jgi:hypothetical protein
MDDDPHSVLSESELLVKKLRQNSILARLTAYALERGITLLVHPDSELMIAENRFSWSFFNFLGEEGLFIFVPFDVQKRKILPVSVVQQIVCFAHEIGHFELRRSESSGAVKSCPVWLKEFAFGLQDVCLLKEILAYLEAVKLLKEICQVSVRSSGWRIALLNLWRQCSACLKAISENNCPKKQAVTEALNGLARAAKFCEKEIAAKLERQKNGME